MKNLKVKTTLTTFLAVICISCFSAFIITLLPQKAVSATSVSATWSLGSGASHTATWGLDSGATAFDTTATWSASSGAIVSGTTATWNLGSGASLSNGTYTLTGADASITSNESFSDFTMQWKVVENSTEWNNDGQKWGVRIAMGNVTKSSGGSSITPSLLPSQLYFYLESDNGYHTLRSPLQIAGVGNYPDNSTKYTYYNAAGYTYKLTVNGTTLTLQYKTSDNGEWIDGFTYTNEYIIGTTGAVTMSVVQGGTYSITDLTLTSDACTISGAGASITTNETFSDFIMQWDVVNNDTGTTNDNNAGVVITMGSNTYDYNGLTLAYSNISSPQKTALYLPCKAWATVGSILTETNVGTADTTRVNGFYNTAGYSYRLIVSGHTLTLYQSSDKTTWTQIYTYTNQYIIGTDGTVSISVLNGTDATYGVGENTATYRISNLTLTNTTTDLTLIEDFESATYTLTGAGASITTNETYSDFTMQWEVVENTTTFNNDTQTRGVYIKMGNFHIDWTGYDFISDVGEQSLYAYLPSSQWSAVYQPLAIPGVGQPDDGASYTTDNGAGKIWKLVVLGTTMTLYNKDSEEAAWTQIYTYTNQYVVGTAGSVSIGVVNGGTYTIKNLTLTSDVYTLSGAGASITTNEIFSDFTMQWKVVENSTEWNNDGQKWGVRIAMGNVTKSSGGSSITPSQLLFHLESDNVYHTLRIPLCITGVGNYPDENTKYTYYNAAGYTYKLTVNGTTLTLQYKTSDNGEWIDGFTYTNEYIIGTAGTVTMSVVQGGTYRITDLSLSVDIEENDTAYNETIAAYMDDNPLNIDNYADGTVENSLPLPYVLVTDTGKGIIIGEQSNLSDGVTVAAAAELYNLKTRTRYYYRVINQDDSLGAIQSFVTDNGKFAPRMIYCEGTNNFRDLGGYYTENGIVRQGLIFRSSRFNQSKTESVTPLLTENGLRVINELGIKSEIDLRRTDNNEVGGLTDTSVLGAGVNYVQTPMADQGNLITLNATQVRDIFVYLSDSSHYPVVYHCHRGVDRTGFVSYLILGLLGVSEEDLYFDYLFSNFSSGGGTGIGALLTYVKGLSSYSGDTLSERIENYLLDIGVTSAQINAVKTIMLEPLTYATSETAATCDTDGVIAYTCAANTLYNHNVVIPKLGHQWVKQVVGSNITFVCDRCDAVCESAFEFSGDATEVNGVYTLSGQYASIISVEEYSDFILEWSVLYNTTLYNNDTATVGVQIKMGNLQLDYAGNAVSTQSLYLNLPSSQWPAVRPKLIIPNLVDSTSFYFGNSGTFRLVVNGDTLTLYQKGSSDANFAQLYTYTNEYIIGTNGTVSMSVVKGGAYTINNLTITRLVTGVYASSSGALSATQDATYNQKLDLHIETLNGGYVRLDRTGDTSGLRFVNLIKKSDYDAIVANNAGANITLGCLVGAKARIDGDLDMSDVNNVNKAQNRPLNKEVSWYVKTIDNVDYYAFNVAIYNIPPTGYEQTIVVRTYVTITYGNGSSVTCYSVDSVERNIKAIATAAYESGDYADDEDALAIIKEYAGITD